MWNRVAFVLREVGAPILAAAVPAGGAVHELIRRVAGKSDPDEIAAVVAQDAKIAEAMRGLEFSHAQELATLGMQAEIGTMREQRQVTAEPADDGGRFVRWARPALVYVLGASVVLELAVALVTVLVEPAQLGALAGVYFALAIPQVALALGCCVVRVNRG